MRSMHDKHTENQSLCLRGGLNMLLLLNKLIAVLLPQFSHQSETAPWTRVAIFWGCSEGSLSSSWLLIRTRKLFERTVLHLTLLFSQKFWVPFETNVVDHLFPFPTKSFSFLSDILRFICLFTDIWLLCSARFYFTAP